MTPSTDSVLPADPLLALASADIQRQAARMAQDAFARVFRLSLGEDEGARVAGVEALRAALANWARAGADEQAQALRLALLLAGMDQWGLALWQAGGRSAADFARARDAVLALPGTGIAQLRAALLGGS